MTAVDDFMQDPPRFMRLNHVVYKGLMPSGPGTARFLLVPFAGKARRRGGVLLGKSTGKADAGAYEIRYVGGFLSAEQRDAGEEFTAFWGGFQAGGAAACTLDNTGPDLMLTPELTGCTIAFVSGANGQARFSHYNLKAGKRTLEAPGMVAAVLDDYPADRDVGILTKEQYHGKSSADMRDRLSRGQELVKKVVEKSGIWARHDGPSANVIGWRNNGVWEFWVQYSDVKGSVRQVLEVRRLAPGINTG